MIEPTVGRIVWVRTGSHPEPLAAIITSVISNTEITVTIFDMACERHQKLELYQGEKQIPAYPYAEWMPYQKGQAAKTEALEKELKK